MSNLVLNRKFREFNDETIIKDGQSGPNKLISDV